jgi:hypothetical protein
MSAIMTTAVPAAVASAAASFGVSRCDKCPERENGGDYEPCRERRRQPALRFGVDDPGQSDLL